MSRNNNGQQDTVRSALIFTGLALMIFVEQLVAAGLFHDEYSYFFNWWGSMILLGIIFLPLAGSVFKGFADRGWLFAQIIGLAVSGWLMWLLASVRLVRFSFGGCVLSVALCAILNGFLWLFMYRLRSDKSTAHTNLRRIFSYSFDIHALNHILLTELLFTGFFIFWLYIKGFQPEAYGTTERLMDFGIMEALWKSDYMPPVDMWLSGEPLNYYYVGQFMGTFLSKLSRTGVGYGYNFTLMTIAAMAMAMPASIVFNMCRDHLSAGEHKKGFITGLTPYITGITAGIAVSFTSNLHYLIFDKLVPVLRDNESFADWAGSKGISLDDFWFPDSTRYIGYNPDTADKTIHEFPLYSFILGDLHAHVINIIFVLTVVAVLYAYVQYRREATRAAVYEYRYQVRNVKGTDRQAIPFLLSEIFHPCVILVGFFIGLFHTTNFWDYPIYFVVAGAVLLFTNAVVYGFSRLTVMITVFHAALVLGSSTIVCLPFTLSFKQISTGVSLCEDHTPLYQLAILWGLPVICVIVFLICNILELKTSGIFAKNAPKGMPGRKNKLFRFIGNLEPSDMFALTLGLCAIGLVLLPEVIYVRDIYTGDYKRANTMFKLTYQAYILFGISAAYITGRFITATKAWAYRIIGVLTLIVIFMLTGYFNSASKAWFGKPPYDEHGELIESSYLFDWLRPENYEGLDAGDYLKDVNPDDDRATKWINENISGRPVMLEVNGDSYSDYCRVSVRTGLPTLLGWTTHEWLWQSNADGAYPEILTVRDDHIKTIYTTDDIGLLRSLIEQYDIEYIYVGDLEKNKYETEINNALLCSIGEVVYPADFDIERACDMTYIVRVDR